MFNQIKTSLTNRKGFEDLIKTNLRTASGWMAMYGCSMGSIFKPFTTQIVASGFDVSTPQSGIGVGIASYHRPYFNDATSGTRITNGVRATSINLNPFGPYTLGENIISGSGVPIDINRTLDPTFVRTFGQKTPFSLVGWGYDIFGYPAPNSAYNWTVSGYFANSGTVYPPNNTFLSSGITTSPSGCDTAPHNFLAGPTDLRWDNFRKVWTGQYGIWAGKIINSYINGSLVGGATTAYANELTFDAQIFDGVANSMVFSGLAPYHLTGSGVAYGSYKIHVPLSGDPVTLQTMFLNNKYQISFILHEVPAASGC